MQQPVSIAPTRLGHLNLFVTDVERSAGFYRDVCGFKEVFREPGISMIFMSNGNTHHDLGLMEITQEQRIGRDGHMQVKPGAGKTPGLNHLGFEMRSEAALVEAYLRAREGNVAINRTTDHQIAHSLYLQELNGHTLEFYADIIEDWKGFYANNAGELISGHWEPGAQTPAADSRITAEPQLHHDDNAILAARNVAYAGLPVQNLTQSLEYYQQVLGMQLVLLDEQHRFAVLKGSAADACDLFLMESEVPATRLLFGGVNLHDGKSIDAALAQLRAFGVTATVVGEGEIRAVIVLDPDQIPLVYSTCSARELLQRHGAAIADEINRLWATARA
ncbi:MAG: VOC family protein [Gammaproteobacteria bacterium]